MEKNHCRLAALYRQNGGPLWLPKINRPLRRTEILEVNGLGKFEAYPNRDSLKYRHIYGLDDILTLYRGTIRRVGFSRAWNIFVQLGMTDDDYIMEGSENMSYREFTNSFLAYNPSDSVELKLRHYLKIDQDDIIWDKLIELDIFNPDKKVGLKDATPAKILQKILTDKWQLCLNDKDMIIMLHKFGYEMGGKRKQLESYFMIKGEDQEFTAMSNTVGLPVGIAVLKILNKIIAKPGVQLPITKEVYTPILEELKEYGIRFKEREVPYLGYNPNNIVI